MRMFIMPKHDCYQAAGRFLMDKWAGGCEHEFTLVHGIVTGQGEIAGVRYGHAWVEDEKELVYDYSNDREIILPKMLYYAIGQVSNTVHYTIDEVRGLVVETGIWGAWDETIRAAEHA